ncbi:diiron oxygenase [Mycobacteroides sp. LB1]|uniref:diiron oxygenase n=1 Tax=Mycobacteroides sp. LB1 TaxID=2750814 RepID=UPI0015DF72E0|nr:diiron oxygenase [Mycobacteroides sp. LB1]
MTSSSYKDINYTDHEFSPATTVDGALPTRRRRVGDRLKTARRLLFEATELSYDPDLDIDWDAPLNSGMHWLAADRVSLYGTPEWDALAVGRQGELARQELVSLLSFVLDAQGALASMMFRDVIEGNILADDYTRFLLASVRDISRNATMVGRLINKTGLELQPAPVVVQRLQRFLVPLIPHGPLGRGFIFLLNRLIHQSMRELEADELAEPVVRQVAKICVLVSRRQLEFAEGELYRAVDTRRYLPPALADVSLALLTVLATSLIVRPQVYRSVGMTPRVGRRAARRSGNNRRRNEVLLQRYFEVAEDAGMFRTGVARAILRRAGLL